jgi:hypothetical protein
MTLPLTAAILLLFIHPARLDTSDFTLIAWDPGRELLKTGTVYANYPYPLWTVVVLLPFVLLPLKWAMVCWTIANLLMLAAALAVLISLFDWEFSSGLFILLIVLFVSFLPVLTSMWLGQLTIFSLLLLVLTVYSFLHQRWTWLGIILGLSFIKPQVMVLLAGFVLLWALFQRRWKVLLGFGGVIVVLVLISLPFISRPGQIIGGGIASHLSTYIQKTSTLWGFLLSLGTPWWVPALISFFLLVWLLFLWWPALHEKELYSERVLFLFSLTTLINLIVIPYSWMHSLALLLLPFAYSLALALKWGLRARLLWLGLLFLTMYPLMLGLFSGLSGPTHSQAYQIVPALALLVIVLILKIRAPRSAT